MEFKERKEEMNSNELLRIIEDNITYASVLRSEISHLTNYPTTVEEEKGEPKKIEEEILEEKEEDSLEDEMNYYIEDYKSIKEYSKESIRKLLPPKNHYHYQFIILRIQAETLKEIKELEELFYLEEDKEVLEDIKNSILKEQEKMNILKEIREEKDVIEEEEKEKNKIVLVPSLSGNIRIIEDLEHLPIDSYDSFKELIHSIIEGNFKGVKRLNSDLNSTNSICEVRGDGTRVLFHRLNKDTYALLSAFLKKTDANKGYKEYLRNMIQSYNLVSDYLKEVVDLEDFQQENNAQLEILFNLLEKEKKEEKKMVK